MRNMIEIKDFDVLAGASIEETVKEAINIAELNDCVVRFDFNGIEIKIYHFSNVKAEVNYYHQKLNEKGKGG